MVDQIRVITGLLNDLAEKVVTRLAVNATSNLIEDTPVDTGWARANWVPAIGAPNTGVETPNSEDARRSGATSRRNAQQAAIARIATGYSLAFGSVFISNNVPYIVALNQGSSRQAPSGFVQAAIQRAISQTTRGLAS